MTSATAKDKQQFFRLTEADSQTLRVALAQRGTTRQAVAGTLALSWLYGLITPEELAQLDAQLPAVAASDETEQHIYRLPEAIALALKVALVSARHTQQSVTAVLVRARAAGLITDDRMAELTTAVAARRRADADPAPSAEH